MGISGCAQGGGGRRGEKRQKAGVMALDTYTLLRCRSVGAGGCSDSCRVSCVQLGEREGVGAQ